MKKKLINVVEPFVELDIERVQNALMLDAVCDEYKHQLRERFEGKDLNELRGSLIDELAEVKTTMHLLAAAYLETVRYKDPDFLRSIPKGGIDPLTSIKLDMRGNVTGDNWHHAECDGRWAGPLADSSIMLPALAAGTYAVEIEVVDELLPHTIDQVTLQINEEHVALTRTGNLPCTLNGRCEITDTKFPFVVLNLHYAGEITSPAVYTSGKNPDARKLVVRVKSINLTRESE